MVSKERKFIFIHNFKTGGTSIENKLGLFDKLDRDVQDHRTIKDFEALTKRDEHFKLSLHTLKKGKIDRAGFHLKNTISPPLTTKEYNEFFKFTFVRNTWARMYSWYSSVMKDELHKKAYGIMNENYSFEEFLLNKINHKKFSQIYFITDSKGNVPMDFIGNFDTLQKDFDIVCERLNIQDSQLPNLLKRNYKFYTEGYTEKTRKLVENLFKDEIDYFGFKFDK